MYEQVEIEGELEKDMMLYKINILPYDNLYLLNIEQSSPNLYFQKIKNKEIMLRIIKISVKNRTRTIEP